MVRIRTCKRCYRDYRTKHKYSKICSNCSMVDRKSSEKTKYSPNVKKWLRKKNKKEEINKKILAGQKRKEEIKQRRKIEKQLEKQEDERWKEQVKIKKEELNSKDYFRKYENPFSNNKPYLKCPYCGDMVLSLNMHFINHVTKGDVTKDYIVALNNYLEGFKA